MTNFVEMW